MEMRRKHPYKIPIGFFPFNGADRFEHSLDMRTAQHARRGFELERARRRPACAAHLRVC